MLLSNRYLSGHFFQPCHRILSYCLVQTKGNVVKERKIISSDQNQRKKRQEPKKYGFWGVNPAWYLSLLVLSSLLQSYMQKDQDMRILAPPILKFQLHGALLTSPGAILKSPGKNCGMKIMILIKCHQVERKSVNKAKKSVIRSKNKV